MANSITRYIPNTFTSLNLVSGCLAIFMAFHHTEQFGVLTGLQWCYIAIGAAAVFDFCDGAMARLLKAYSKLGGELDSLSDLVSFGVAPAAMILNVMLEHTDKPWMCAATLLIPVMGALRLARFNIDTTQTTSFRGLPIPANAIFWIGMSGWIARYSYPGTGTMVVVILLVSLSMVSSMRLFSLKVSSFGLRENFRRYVLMLAAVVFIVIYGVSGLLWAIMLYVLLSVLSRNREA